MKLKVGELYYITEHPWDDNAMDGKGNPAYYGYGIYESSRISDVFGLVHRFFWNGERFREFLVDMNKFELVKTDEQQIQI